MCIRARHEDRRRELAIYLEILPLARGEMLWEEGYAIYISTPKLKRWEKRTEFFSALQNNSKECTSLEGGRSNAPFVIVKISASKSAISSRNIRHTFFS